MAFQTRKKNKKNNENDECSTQLITKQSTTTNINPYYDTFGVVDENNDNPSTIKTIPTAQKLKISKLRVRKTSSNKSSALSPIISAPEDNHDTSSPKIKSFNPMKPMYQSISTPKPLQFTSPPSTIPITNKYDGIYT